MAIPFACGFTLGEFLPAEFLPKPDARLVTSIFLGTALSISSVKIVAMVIREMNFMRRDLGQIIIASAILEDTIGWVIIAVAFGLAAAGTIDVWSVSRAIVGTGLFMIASFTVGRRIVFRLIRWANDNFRSDFPVITTILIIMAAMALTTQLIGVNTVLGAFVAGILIGESPILTRHIDEELRGLIVALFMPVFFGLSGLNADLTILRSPDLALLAVGLIAIASIGKFLGAFIGGTVGGLSRAESLALGCGMNARGSTEVIVATLGLSTGLLSQNLFTLIVTMAIVTTTAMPSMLRWSLKRLPLRKKERLRLEREELDAKGFVTNLERLLVAADDSANGKFAAQLAGIIAGSSGKPTTILDLTARTKKASADKAEEPAKTTRRPSAPAKSDRQHSEQAVKRAAAATTSLEPDPGEEKPENVDVITRQRAAGPEAVANEASKGYDLLVVGIANTRDPKGSFSKDLSLITRGFEGPLAVVDTRASSREAAPPRHGRILIPVNGTEVSRRAVEVGLLLARASDAHVTALYVTRTSPVLRSVNPAAWSCGATNWACSRTSPPWPSAMTSHCVTRPVPIWPPTRRFCAKPATAMISSSLASAADPATCYSLGTPERRFSNGRRHRFSSSRVSIAKARIQNGPNSEWPQIRNGSMSIIPLLAQSAFDPETIETLVSVFEAAWRKVEQSGSKLASPAYKRAAQEIIAKRIIEMAQRGERNPDELADDAVSYLDRSYA